MMPLKRPRLKFPNELPDGSPPKKARSEVPSQLPDEHRQDSVDNEYETDPYGTHFSQEFMAFMYRLDLSVLCSVRKSAHEDKYPSLSLSFDDSEMDEFSHIVVRYKKKSICVQVEVVDKYYGTDKDITYGRLFRTERRSWSIHRYFDSFVKLVISGSETALKNIQYLVMYTNAGLELTEKNKFKKSRVKNFFAFQFESVNTEDCGILKDFLRTEDSGKFYRFSQDEATREEVLKRLQFSPATLKVIEERQLLTDEIKGRFVEKLVFAVNQPSRETLNSIVKSEIKMSEVADYLELQDGVLRNLTSAENRKRIGIRVSEALFEFNLLMGFLHDVFTDKNLFSVNTKTVGGSNIIVVRYRNRISYVKAHAAGSKIGYSQLFFRRKRNQRNMLDLTPLIEELRKKDIRYFIIYMNTDLDLTERKELKQTYSKDFYPLKFERIDVGKKKFKILRNRSCVNADDLYQFTQAGSIREELLRRLQLPRTRQREGRLSNEDEEEVKGKFARRLIFAVNQPGEEKLSSMLREKVDEDYEYGKVPYRYEELREIAFRWTESHEFMPITRGMMEKLLTDITNCRSSSVEILNENINEEIKFARAVVGLDGVPMFFQFLHFIVKGEGKAYLEVIKRYGINLSNVSGMLHSTKSKSAEAFTKLHDLWFNGGCRTRYLTNLEKAGINLSTISGIVHGARSNAANACKELCDLWFDRNGDKRKYLTKLEENGVDLLCASSILLSAGVNASKAFKDLYNLWLDENGYKTKYLKTLEKEEVSLSSMSSILSGAGANAAAAFKDFYDLLFDGEGRKTKYLNSMENAGINLSSVSSILHKAGCCAAKAFRDLYNLWFDADGNKKGYLKTLERETVNISAIASMLSGSGPKAAYAFKNLLDILFDEHGNKDQCLETLEKNGINLSSVTSILNGAGIGARKAFKDLYDLWFDEEGNKTYYLETLERENVCLGNVSSILHRAGGSAATAFQNLFHLWFDEHGNKTKYLKNLEEEGIHLINICAILHGAGSKACEAFKDLHDFLFDKKRGVQKYLKSLNEEGILSNMFTILGGAGSNAPKAFKELYELWFDEEGNKKPQLKHFIEEEGRRKSFTVLNLSSILGGAGPKAKHAFESFHNVCFNEEGKRTERLEAFCEAGFKPSNLSCLLCKTGYSATSTFKKIHNMFFNAEKQRMNPLDDFYNAGFRPGDLCSMLSAAADNFGELHNFCFVAKSKKFLLHFLAEGFTPKHLANMLHGSRANVCSALKNLHDVCFDGRGEKSQILNDFYDAGFDIGDLSRVAAMAGNNASSVLRNFHKACFEKKYLRRFLKDGKFTQKDLSKILYGVGINVYPSFKKLHGLCFDKAGNGTSYLDELIEYNRSKMVAVLYERIKGGLF